MTRTSTGIDSSPPSLSIRLSSRARKSFACTFALMSPISSRKSVPPFACSNLPFRRAAAARAAAFVKLARNQFLAGARFASHQNGGIGVGDFFDHRAHALHRFGIADQSSALRRLNFNAAPKRKILAPQLDVFKSVLDDQAKIVQLERLRDVIIGAA